jgi:hypothetical protein
MGMAMQHMGAMLFELGRTMMMLRMGQSPVCIICYVTNLLFPCFDDSKSLPILQPEAFVNAGPAVYINSTGPNPIMVQVINCTVFPYWF